MKTIVLLLNRNNTGPHYGYKVLAEEFRRLGYKTTLLEAFHEDLAEQLVSVYRSEDVAFTLTHNMLKTDLRIDDQDFYTHFNSVCISLTDTPLPKYDLIRKCSGHVALLLGDITNEELVHRINPEIKVFEWIAYNNIFDDKPVPLIAERTIDVLFAGRVGNGLESLQSHSFLLRQFGYKIARRHGFQNEKQVEEIVLEELKNPVNALMNKLFYRLDLNRGETWDFLWHTVQYIRAARRNLVLNELIALPSSVSMTIITDDDHAEEIRNKKKPNVTVYPFLPWPEVLGKMREAKLTVNVMPFQINSSHERIATAQYNGSVVLTDSNPWLRANYREGDELFFYLYKKNALRDSVISLLCEDPAVLQRVADQGSAKSRALHMPSNRAAYIVDVYEQMLKILN
ncbi:MAG TPA: hypothetical protein VI731_03790 [Bacteroidia bacterium]|nr:hypothetical protein [Bacteroidia bacterium]